MDNQFAPQPTQEQPSQQPVTNQTPPTPVTSSRKSAKPWLFLLLVILLMAGAVYGTYSWQHNKNTTLNAQVTSLKGQAAGQAAKISDLNKQLSASKAATQNKAASSTGPFDQTAAITQAVKAYKDNVKDASQATVTINGVTASGNAAYGAVALPGGGNAAWLAINSKGNWSVVSQGTVGVCKDQIQQYNLPAAWEPPGGSIC